jgi:glycosyltransferase involved in cell wall biosynthesis
MRYPKRHVLIPGEEKNFSSQKKMKVFQINTAIGEGSTGRIAEDIGNFLLKDGHDCCVAFSRGKSEGQFDLFRIGNKIDFVFHGLHSFLFDRHGLSSSAQTRLLVSKIEQWKPDVIHLHNIHGYYLHYQVLFDYLRSVGTPVVWTFHDSWPYTGHCTYFDNVNCLKWIEGCHHCPKTNKYPRSLILDRSKKNFLDKKSAFSTLENLTIVTPSRWLQSLVSKSFFKEKSIISIHNGINTDVFKPLSAKLPDGFERLTGNRKIILGVANIWDTRKGFNEFIKLSHLLSDDYVIALIGHDPSNQAKLPHNIIKIGKTKNAGDLALWYANSFAFVNPTFQDNFPTTNIEAQACGTPVITYNTGGSPEAIDDNTGMVVEKGDVEGIWNCIQELGFRDQASLRHACRQRALTYFDKNIRFKDYLFLYQNLVNTKNRSITTHA